AVRQLGGTPPRPMGSACMGCGLAVQMIHLGALRLLPFPIAVEQPVALAAPAPALESADEYRTPCTHPIQQPRFCGPGRHWFREFAVHLRCAGKRDDPPLRPISSWQHALPRLPPTVGAGTTASVVCSETEHSKHGLPALPGDQGAGAITRRTAATRMHTAYAAVQASPAAKQRRCLEAAEATSSSPGSLPEAPLPPVDGHTAWESQ